MWTPRLVGVPPQPPLGAQPARLTLTDTPKIRGAALGTPRASPLLSEVRPHRFLQRWGGPRGWVTPWSRFLSSQNPAALKAGGEHRAPIATWGSHLVGVRQVGTNDCWGSGAVPRTPQTSRSGREEFRPPEALSHRPTGRAREGRWLRVAPGPLVSVLLPLGTFCPASSLGISGPARASPPPGASPDQPCRPQAPSHDSSCPAAPS